MSNNKYKLSFISDDDLMEHTLETVSQFRSGMTLDILCRNVVDPIKLTFDVHVYKQSIEQVVESEVIRQLNKSNENLIGYFHQNIFKYVGNGWEVPGPGSDGWDVENHERNIFVEIKNKHNTMNSNSAGAVHGRMRGLIEGNRKAHCYLVEVIAKKSRVIPLKLGSRPLLDERQERLRKISIDRFYKLVTGDEKAFASLCSVLGRVIDDVIAANPLVIAKNSVLAELLSKDPDILKSLFLISFNSYLGFDEFQIQKS